MGESKQQWLKATSDAISTNRVRALLVSVQTLIMYFQVIIIITVNLYLNLVNLYSAFL